MANFSERIKELRSERGMTQEALGRIIGGKPDSIYVYEKGKAYPAVRNLLLLADFFDISTDYLLGRTDNPEINRKPVGIAADFSERLREMRYSQNMTQAALGKIIDVGQDSISVYENGRHYPEVRNLIILADFFSVSTDYLLGRSDRPEINQ